MAKIHKDAIEQLDYDYLKEKHVINDSMIEETSMGSITNYCVSRDPEYMKIDRNPVTERLHDHIRDKAIETFKSFPQTLRSPKMGGDCRPWISPIRVVT